MPFETDGQTELPYLRSAVSNRPTYGETYRTADMPFQTDRHTDRHTEPQMCRFKQIYTQTCGISDVPFETNRQTDMPKWYLLLEKTERQTDVHVELQMGFTKRRTERHTDELNFMFRFKQRNRQTCRNPDVPFETDGQSERHTEPQICLSKQTDRQADRHAEPQICRL